jgi:hypothetical protein
MSDAASAKQPTRSAWASAWLAAIVLLLAGAAANVWYLLANCPLDLAGDEAHYWEWSRRLDLSYYSKGPLVAYVIALGRLALGDWSRALLGNEVLAVRGPAIALSVLTGLGIFVLTALTLRRPRLALAATALTCTMPILTVGSLLMTIDTPLMFTWVWALVCLALALRRDGLGWWIATGLLCAVGILAKYNMVFLYAVGGGLMLVEPELRRHWRRSGPYVAALLGTLGLVPIAIWNAQHGWVSLRHVAGQAGVAGARHFNLLGPLEYAAGQLGVINAIWAVLLVCAAYALWRRPRAGNEPHTPWEVRLLVTATVVPWLVFLAFSVITKIQPNWPVLGLVAGCPVLALWLARRLGAADDVRRFTRRLVITGVALGLLLTVLARRSDWLLPITGRLADRASPLNPTPLADYELTARLRGWRELGAAVGELLARERAAGRAPFVMTDDYQTASEIAFYCPGNPTVYSAQSVFGGRQSQYDIWPNPVRDRALFIGRPCIYVGGLRDVLLGGDMNTIVAASSAANQAATSPAGVTFITGADAALPALTHVRDVTARVGGRAVQFWAIYTAPRFAGFPEGAATWTHKY